MPINNKKNGCSPAKILTMLAERSDKAKYAEYLDNIYIPSSIDMYTRTRSGNFLFTAFI